MIPDWQVNCVYFASLLQARHPSVFAVLQETLLSHGIEVRLLEGVRDIWARDYCPIQVLPKTLVKFEYAPDYLRDSPEMRTGDEVLPSFRDIGWCNRSNVVLDGGNVAGSETKAIVTDKIFRENPGWLRPNLKAKIQKLLHVDQLIVIPKEPFDPIGHADGMVRSIDEQTVLVNDYSEVDPGFGERLLKVLRKYDLAIETLPYFHERRTRAGIPSAVGCYVNFLRTEKVVIVPAFGSQHDHLALERLRSLLPKVPVVSLDATSVAREGGVFNCISASFRRPSSSE